MSVWGETYSRRGGGVRFSSGPKPPRRGQGILEIFDFEPKTFFLVPKFRPRPATPGGSPNAHFQAKFGKMQAGGSNLFGLFVELPVSF